MFCLQLDFQRSIELSSEEAIGVRAVSTVNGRTTVHSSSNRSGRTGEAKWGGTGSVKGARRGGSNVRRANNTAIIVK